MISDDFFVYLLVQIVLLTINLIGYSKIPILSFLGIIGTVMMAWPTVVAFGDYPQFALLLILVNISLPTIGITRAIT
jgi:hypothetical protein